MFIISEIEEVRGKVILRIFNSNLHLSSRVDAGKLWRQRNKLPKLQTARGPLIDLPDYSFLGFFL